MNEQRSNGHVARMPWSACLALALRAAAALVVCLYGPPASGQVAAQRDQLEVRITTPHYALSGTVSDRTLREYGDLLEFIYREYAAGFAGLLEAQEPETAVPQSQLKNQPKPGKVGKAAKRNRRGAPEDPVVPPDSPAPPPGGAATAPQSGGGGTEGAAGQAAATQPAGVAAEPAADERFRVLVFGTQHEYQEFGRAFLGGAEHTSGMFVPSANALLILDRGNPDDTMQTLFHEAFHQFMHRYIKDPPMWLNEGLATYYGDMRVRRGRLLFQPDADRWRMVRKLLEKDDAVPLSTVVQASRAEFYDQTPIKVRGYENVRRATAFYNEAYTLIHLLLSDATARARLQDYIRALAEDDGRNTAKITAEFFGPAVCAHMHSYWVNHVNSRPEQNSGE